MCDKKNSCCKRRKKKLNKSHYHDRTTSVQYQFFETKKVVGYVFVLLIYHTTIHYPSNQFPPYTKPKEECILLPIHIFYQSMIFLGVAKKISVTINMGRFDVYNQNYFE